METRPCPRDQVMHILKEVWQRMKVSISCILNDIPSILKLTKLKLIESFKIFTFQLIASNYADISSQPKKALMGQYGRIRTHRSSRTVHELILYKYIVFERYHTSTLTYTYTDTYIHFKIHLHITYVSQDTRPSLLWVFSRRLNAKNKIKWPLRTLVSEESIYSIFSKYKEVKR